MLKKSLALVMLLAFGAMSFTNAIVLTRFYANQRYIRENLCENRNNPNAHCCGKCQLRKKLRQENNPDMNNAGINENKFETLSSKSSYAEIGSVIRSSKTVPFTNSPQENAVDQPSDFFHPPDFQSYTF